MYTYIKFKIENIEFEFNTKSKYFVTEIKTIDDIRFDCNRYTDELVKQLHIDNIFHMIQNEIRPFMVLTREEFENYCEKVLKVNYNRIQLKLFNVIADYVSSGEL